MRLLARSFIFLFLFLAYFLFLPPVFAATTSFRSASIVTTDGATAYTNLNNCSLTDGNTCDRTSGSSYGNLYFRDFGNYSDFEIPSDAAITKIRVRALV